LGRIASSDKEVIDALLILAKDHAVREEALFALGELKVEEVIPHLADELASDILPRRQWMSHLLIDFGPRAKAALAALAKALVDSAGSVRRNACRALGNIGPDAQSAAKALGKALNDPDRLVRVQAALALVKIQKRSEPALTQLKNVAADGDPEISLE